MGKSLDPTRLITGGLGAAADIYKASREEKMYYDNLNWQKEQYYDSQNFSREQADTQWQREKEMFNMENEYNSAASQVQRYKDAGLNPAVMMQGNAASVASGGAASVGQSVAPPQLQMDNLPTGAAGAIGSAMSHAGDIMKGLADAKKAGIDVSMAEETFDDMVRKIKGDADAVEVENALKGWQLFTEKVFGFKIKNKELERLTAETNLLIQNGQVAEAEKLLKKEMERWYKGQADYQEEYNKYAGDLIQGTLKLNQEQIKTEKSYQNLNAANAREAYAAAQKILDDIKTNEELRKVYRATAKNYEELSKMSEAERKSYIINTIGLYEDKTGIHIDQAVKVSLQEMMLNSMNLELESKQWNVWQQKQDFYNPFNMFNVSLGMNGNLTMPAPSSGGSRLQGGGRYGRNNYNGRRGRR